MSADQANTDHV